MDFLEIRRKAKERAAAEAAPGAATRAGADAAGARASPVPGAPPAPDAAPAPAPGVAEPAVGQLAAELQALPPARDDAREEPPGENEQDAEHDAEPDARFTTWRPGTGERPFIPPPDAPPRPEPASAAAPPPPAPASPPRPFTPDPAPAVARPAPPPSPAAPEPALEPEPFAQPTHRWSAARSPAPVPLDPLDEFFYRRDEELPAASALPADAEAEAPEPEDARVEEYLTFQLGEEEYAVAIERVREVLKSQHITEVPRAPAGILGVVTVRGDVVAVFDPRHRLGLPGPTPDPGFGRIIIVDDGEGPCGLLVDLVASVVRLARGSIEPTPQGIGGASADCLSGIGREKNRLFTVLDLSALLRRGPGAARGARGAHARS